MKLLDSKHVQFQIWRTSRVATLERVTTKDTKLDVAEQGCLMVVLRLVSEKQLSYGQN